MAKTISGRVQMRIDTLANWQSANPTLLLNEVVGEIQADNTTIKFKRGDGTTAYNTLGYVGIPGPSNDNDPANKEYVDNSITSATIETFDAVIRKDGTSTTTAAIPFAQGVNTNTVNPASGNTTTFTGNISAQAGINFPSGGITAPADTRMHISSGNDLVLTAVDDGSHNTIIAGAHIKAKTQWGGTGQPFMATEDDDVITKQYWDDNREQIVNEFAIRSDGTTHLGNRIPFSAGIEVTNIFGENDGDVNIQGDLNMVNHKITHLANPVADNDAATKSYVDNAIAEATSGISTGVKIVDVTIPTGSWTAYGDSGKAWQYTVSNAAFEANDYVSIDASVDEIVSHLGDTPITSLTASRATAGSCTVYAISDEAPDAQYSIQLVVHKVVS